MQRYEAIGFSTEVRELLVKAANGMLTEEEENRLLELEELAILMFDVDRDDLRIIRNDGTGSSDDPKKVAYNSVVPVTDIEARTKTTLMKIDDVPTEVEYVEYVAYSDKYAVLPNEDGRLVDERGIFIGRLFDVGDAPEGARITQDYAVSGPEGFVKDEDGVLKQFGAASALVARLLEAKAEGVI